jgi:plastocyanin
MACTLLAGYSGWAGGAEAFVTVLGANGMPVAGAVVVAEPQAPAARPTSAGKAVMDQHNLTFQPEVLVIRAGTAVDFPNSDQVLHMVYSFSGAKFFQLPLYAGHTQPPVVFDKPGLVTLGCNIHDNMIGYIYVSESPWYGRTGSDGTLVLRELPPGSYTLRIWHPLLQEDGPQLAQHLLLAEGGDGTASFRLKHALRAPLMHHGADKKWADY